MNHLSTEVLSAYLDNALEDTERVTVQSHLPACELCREQLQELSFARDALRSLPTPVIPELHRKQLWREINRARRAPATRWRALVAVAGTAAAIAAFAGLTMLGSTSGPNVSATGIELRAAGQVTDADLDALLAQGSPEFSTAAGAEAATTARSEHDLSVPAPEASAPAAPLADDAGGQVSTNDGAQIANCETVIQPGGDRGAIARQYLLGVYQGQDVYVLVYDIPRNNPDHVEVFVVSRQECRVLAHRSSV
jgi:hypothetical protein